METSVINRKIVLCKLQLLQEVNRLFEYLYKGINRILIIPTLTAIATILGIMAIANILS